ncbi:MAG: hypothetical protein C0505_05805 [Leptothrix sp. (in: Bacteria)]|nr:hypothetical protein [Leptothrix sp. (in: b-proteobacteria)]
MSRGSRPMAAAAALTGLLLAAALAADLRATQQALARQLEARNHDAAAVLAAALSQPGQDEQALRAVAMAQFAAGHTVHLRVHGAGGAPTVVDLRRPPAPTAAPGWFRRALPLPAAGVVSLGEPGRPAGALEIEADPAWAHEALWESFLRTGVAAIVLALLSLGVLLRALIRRSSAPPAGAGTQAAATLPTATPATPDAALQQWHEAFAAQAEQVAHLQRQAQLDAVTGLPLRHAFLGQLQQRLDETGGPGLALLIVRVLDLETVNRRLGHAATDRLLGAVADVLLTYVDRVPAMRAGRLNGSDFALCLPVAGVAAETAESLRNALAAAPALRTGLAEVAVGGVDGVRGVAAGDALAAADAALARAEADGDPAAASVVLQASAQGEVLGAGAWTERIHRALVEGRTTLRSQPVQDAQGRLLHLECTLQVQLRPGGPHEPADRWRAAARRGRLLWQVDLVAVERAIEAIAADGRARAVQISRSSLSAPGFTTDVAAALAAAARGAARQLALELVNDARAGAVTAPVASALSLWARAGVRMGLDCSGGAPPELPELKAAGLQYVKIDAGQLQGLAHDDAVRSYARGLVALVHGLGLALLVGGVRDDADAVALWALGVDAASGPALTDTSPSGTSCSGASLTAPGP